MSDTQPIEVVVLKIVTSFVSTRLKTKYGLEWSEVKDKPSEKDDYNEKRTKVAKDAFFAVRARTGVDFVDFFVSTLCSVPQRMTDESFVELSKQLGDPERASHIRTLTLLALSARS